MVWLESHPPHKTRPKEKKREKKMRERERQSTIRSTKTLPVDNPISCPSCSLFTLHKSCFSPFLKSLLCCLPPFFCLHREYPTVNGTHCACALHPLFVIQDASCLLLQQRRRRLTASLSHGNICSAVPAAAAAGR